MRTLGLLAICLSFGLMGCEDESRGPAEVNTCVDEICDGLDNDCDGDVDEDFDLDGDLYFTADNEACAAVHTPLDCDDNDSNNFPGNTEACDGKDNDCDAETFAEGGEADEDGDGAPQCNDCDDADPDRFTGKIEICDGKDNNCDGLIDEGFDEDADEATTCGPDGVADTADDDCDDSDPDRYPGNEEICDDQDSNCVNDPPATPTVDLSACGPVAGRDDLVCRVGTGSSSECADLDSFAVSYRVAWQLDGVAYSGPVATVDVDGDSIAAANLVEGEWSCEVTPYDGMIDGTPASATARAGGPCTSLAFQNGSYAEVPDDVALALVGSSYTAEFWVLTDAAAGGPILDKNDGWQTNNSFRMDTGGFVINGGTEASSARFDSAPPAGRWHHVAYSYDLATDTLAGFVDGVLQTFEYVENNPANPFRPGGLVHDTVPLIIGAANRADIRSWDGYHLDGQIAGIRLSKVARYTADFTPSLSLSTDADTLALWSFDEATGTLLNDASGNGHHATIHGPTWSDTCPGQDLDCDGVPAWQDCDDNDAAVAGGPC